ncbi:Zinc ABC transporter, ATP-binding protein ZnuC [hydrothermal vent metagenome]|uniref:Zinc ABC transporter, ATP-binding protein ZnuC n=1 Tax=hydrothermal vent metagenome TaxID=652676 RepID=A0A3B1DT83_9ZZZZ
MSIITIKNLSFNYNKTKILENINLCVDKKDFLAIIGPNGGGKTTLLQLILGIKSFKKGMIDISTKNIGYVPQNTNININFPIKAIEVVLMGHANSKKKNFGYAKDEKQCAMSALKQVGMTDFYNKKIGSLSGGQRQRVMIARALCGNPNILLLDEPTSSIDTTGQRQIYDLLKKLNETMPIVVVSHDISIILGYASKVAHINKTISYHDISSTIKQFNTHGEHFCEVELLQMLSCKNTQKSSLC